MSRNTEVQVPGDSGLTRALLSWYDRCRRILPWREDPAPYHVWISEIMLQQTRVEAVRDYYARFLARFPDVRALAEADEQDCLKLWEGLGYYSRARNLQKAARQILSEYGGTMPGTAEELRKLAGIGPYTSAAIASIAFGEKIPAVDGNLLRVFSRLALYEEDCRTPAAAAAARSFYLSRMPEDRPGDFNQALMDLGALVCTPGDSPRCIKEEGAEACPLQSYCGAFREGRCGELPVMPAKKARRIDRKTVLVIRDGSRVLIRKRPPRGLLAGLYEYPNEEGWLSLEEAVAAARSCGTEPVHVRRLPDAKHIFTHREWHMRGYELILGNHPAAEEPEGFVFATIRDLKDKYPLPGAFAAFAPEQINGVK